jgi:hypothetical protein
MAEQEKPMLVCDERFRRDKERIEKMEEAIDRISAVDAKLGFVVDQLKTRQDEQEQRIGDLEKKPARRWELVVTTVITLALGGVFGYIVKSV